MKNIYPIVLLLLVPFSVHPQNEDAKIEAIREQYKKVKAEIEKIETNEEAAIQSSLAVNELVVNKLNKSWPAVGNYSVVYRFYYKQKGEEPYPDHLVLVKKKTLSAARKIFEEILFSEVGGLIFSYEKEESGEEHRIYFDEGVFITYRGKRNEEAAKTLTAGAIERARQYGKLFALSIE